MKSFKIYSKDEFSKLQNSKLNIEVIYFYKINSTPELISELEYYELPDSYSYVVYIDSEDDIIMGDGNYFHGTSLQVGTEEFNLAWSELEFRGYNLPE